MQRSSKKFTFINLNNANRLLLILTTILAIMAGTLYVVNRFGLNKNESLERTPSGVEVPSFLLNSFPNTDWSKVGESVENALNGGPGKDGIPAIDEPKFVSLSTFEGSDEIQAIAVEEGENVKLYPYNILVWHEIVNDTINGVPLAITFCPLCGSAVAFERTLSDGSVSTFGVSGALIESNMVMYDRNNESLWQQSTGESIAGKNLGEKLKIYKFQLLTIAQAKSKHPSALILSDETGYSRDYQTNPYSGYEDNEDFIFTPSSTDERYPSKTIFVAYKLGDVPVASPWLELKDGQTYRTEINGQQVTLSKEEGELTILDGNGAQVPFYFEMWFSWAIQNQDEGIVYDPNK